MKGFKYNAPTAVFTGEECVMNNSALLHNFGKKCYIMTSQFPPGVPHLSLEDSIKACEKEGIEYKVYDTCEENPSVTSVAKVTEVVREFEPDFFIACGGGSAIDTTKAVTVLLKHPGEDPYDVLYKKGGVNFTSLGYDDADAPIVTIPTTAGTGSEISPFSVLTNEKIDNKLGISAVVYPKVAFLDAKYIKDAPPRLIHSGAIDALAHGVETYLNVSSNPMLNALAMAGFEMFSHYKDDMMNNSLSFEQFQEVSLAATVFGMSMQAGTTLPHGMGYPLTHHKNVPHGLACGVFLGEHIRSFKNTEIAMPVVKACGFDSIDEFADYINKILENDLNIEVTMDEIEKWTDEMFANKRRINNHPEPIDREGIKGIFVRSLKKWIVD